MSTHKPVWLLDFDGVVNVIGRKVPRWPGPIGKATAQGFPLRWAPALVDAINDIHAAGLAEVRWATTWLEGGAVAEVEKAVGIGPFSPAYSRRFSRVHDEEKVDAARAVLASGRRLVWTDDAVIPSRRVDVAGLLGSNDGSYLTVRPPETRGLSPDNINAIVEFCHA